jgi:hypothetical protein
MADGQEKIHHASVSAKNGRKKCFNFYLIILNLQLSIASGQMMSKTEESL